MLVAGSVAGFRVLSNVSFAQDARAAEISF